MYVPRHNRLDDRETLVAFIQAHSFAALVTSGGTALQATHLPFVVELEGERVRLIAHLARANPQWQDFATGREALVIFAEPHAYVSPLHYERAESVPTWNYAAVHAYGSPRILEDRECKRAEQAKLIALHDTEYLSRFRELRPEYLDRMLDAIVSFEIDAPRLEARFKLSQDKQPVERQRIIAALEASDDTNAGELARWMRSHGER